MSKNTLKRSDIVAGKTYVRMRRGFHVKRKVVSINSAIYWNRLRVEGGHEPKSGIGVKYIEKDLRSGELKVGYCTIESFVRWAGWIEGQE
jgi:hypothetical protein